MSVIASSKGFGVGALPETASNAAFALAAALPIVDLPLVTLALGVFFDFLFVVFVAVTETTFAAFALAAALPVVDLLFVTLVLVGFFAFLFVVFVAFTKTTFVAFAATGFLAMLFFAPAVVAFALEEVFLTVAFFVDGGFFAPAGVLRLFVVFFAIGAFLAGAFFAFSLVGDMGGIIIGIRLLGKG